MPKEGNGSIYTIRHKADARVCYVGQTRREPKKRWANYASGRNPIARAVQMMGGISEFECVVIEEVPFSELGTREAYWINTLGTLAPNGLNQMSGGEGSFHSAATREKIAKANKGKTRNAEQKARLSAAARLRAADPEIAATRREADRRAWEGNAGRRAAVSAATKARLEDPEQRKLHAQNRVKGVEKWRGSKHNEASKAKMAEAAKRVWAARKAALCTSV